MRILLQTDNPNSPSFEFYAESLGRINDTDLEATVTVGTGADGRDYAVYDVALFMGGSNRSTEAKRRKADLVCGVVEPRSAQRNDFRDVDLIVVNGLEALDFFAGSCPELLTYPVYPALPEGRPTSRESHDGVVLGYHGNKLHLEAMVPRITDAIRRLHRRVPTSLWAMYNVRELGKSKLVTSRRLGFPVVHIDFGRENYARYMAQVDVGLVPQLIPTRRSGLLRYLLGSLARRYNEKPDDYLLRFKETTNLGRHLVFAQLGIPVVSDMTPSACNLIRHGESGYLAHGTEGWFAALHRLASDPPMARALGARLKEEWEARYAHDLLNADLVAALRRLRGERRSEGKEGECAR